MPIILCLDPGTSHTGIAISQEGILATPLATIYEKDLELLVAKINLFIEKYKPNILVIGIPEFGPVVAFATGLGDRLRQVFPGEIIFHREDLSSGAARHTMKELKKTLVKRKREEHQTAAALILQDYLDSL